MDPRRNNDPHGREPSPPNWYSNVGTSNIWTNPQNTNNTGGNTGNPHNPLDVDVNVNVNYHNYHFDRYHDHFPLLRSFHSNPAACFGHLPPPPIPIPIPQLPPPIPIVYPDRLPIPAFPYHDFLPGLPSPHSPHTPAYPWEQQQQQQLMPMPAFSHHHHHHRAHGPCHCAPPRNHQAQTSSSFLNDFQDFPDRDYSGRAPSPDVLPRPNITHQNPYPTFNNQSRPGQDTHNSDDNYLAALGGDFSSPSLPPLSSSPFQPPRPQSLFNLPEPLEVGQDMPATRPRASRGDAVESVDLTKEEPDYNTSGIDLSTPTLTMPTTRRQSAVSAARSTGSPVRKKRRSSTSGAGRANKVRRRETTTIEPIASPFDDDDVLNPPAHEVHETIDLSNATEVPKELMVPKVDNRTKLGHFQCVICMDDVTALTVTHCGHLFCSECLHSALHIDNMKRTCPVCRTKIDAKDKKGKNTKTFYHLELKMMTATKKGKRPAGL
ncbi:Uu.00g059880.m01.CDS01 [Anthostomella pinea]|uniref:Uu.00g059880.m01.CDS01 n=1 Tax=Anthostomella pinea TaxID=933095 RepID=A0AAI8VS77_9PEZI|nr:Uu.00g059880.m01.CDS01 [Anthostomella pinea]